MKKRFISMTLIMIIIFMLYMLTSCSKSDKKDVIQIWWYEQNDGGYYQDAVTAVLNKIFLYAKENDIPLEIVKYNKRIMSYDNYKLKRNSAMAAGNVIVIDDARNLADIASQHYDYSKIERYNLMLDVYKNRYCIPLGIGYINQSVYNDMFDYYNIKFNNSVITYTEYLDAKQQMLDKGAKFLLNNVVWDELVDANLIKNDLYELGYDSTIIGNENNFKQAMKNTVIGIYDDYMKYYDGHNQISYLDNPMYENDIIFDATSKVNLLEESFLSYTTHYSRYFPYGEKDYNKTFIIKPDITQLSPCIYVNKEVTNEKIIDLVNQMIDISYYKVLVYIIVEGQLIKSPYFSPTFQNSDIQNYADVDEKWKYNEMYSHLAEEWYGGYATMIERVNEAYEALYMNGEKSQKNADYYFSNPEYNNSIKKGIKELVIKLIEERLDCNDVNVNRMLNRKIDEIVMNFYVHYN